MAPHCSMRIWARATVVAVFRSERDPDSAAYSRSNQAASPRGAPASCGAKSCSLCLICTARANWYKARFVRNRWRARRKSLSASASCPVSLMCRARKPMKMPRNSRGVTARRSEPLVTAAGGKPYCSIRYSSGSDLKPPKPACVASMLCCTSPSSKRQM